MRLAAPWHNHGGSAGSAEPRRSRKGDCLVCHHRRRATIGVPMTAPRTSEESFTAGAGWLGTLDEVARALGRTHPGAGHRPVLDRTVAGQLTADFAHLLFPEQFADPHGGHGSLGVRHRLWVLGRAAWNLAHLVHDLGAHDCPHDTPCPLLPLAMDTAQQFVRDLPHLRDTLLLDAEAAVERDPATDSAAEVITTYPGFLATLVYRTAHRLWELGVPLLPRTMAEWAHSQTGIDIHPAAQIGPRFFIDHGTGVVIGETTAVGAGVTLYQGVTLGALSFPRDAAGHVVREAKRHPTLEDGVTVYAEATILGGHTVVGHHSEVGGNVWLTDTIPPYSRVVAPSHVERRRRAGAADPLPPAD